MRMDFHSLLTLAFVGQSLSFNLKIKDVSVNLIIGSTPENCQNCFCVNFEAEDTWRTKAVEPWDCHVGTFHTVHCGFMISGSVQSKNSFHSCSHRSYSKTYDSWFSVHFKAFSLSYSKFDIGFWHTSWFGEVHVCKSCIWTRLLVAPSHQHSFGSHHLSVSEVRGCYFCCSKTIRYSCQTKICSLNCGRCLISSQHHEPCYLASKMSQNCL